MLKIWVVEVLLICSSRLWSLRTQLNKEQFLLIVKAGYELQPLRTLTTMLEGRKTMSLPIGDRLRLALIQITQKPASCWFPALTIQHQPCTKSYIVGVLGLAMG